MKFHPTSGISSRCFSTTGLQASQTPTIPRDTAFKSHLHAATTRHRKKLHPNRETLLGISRGNDEDEAMNTGFGSSEVHRHSATSKLRSQIDRTRLRTEKSLMASLSATEIYRAEKALGLQDNESSTASDSLHHSDKSATTIASNESTFSWIASLWRP